MPKEPGESGRHCTGIEGFECHACYCRGKKICANLKFIGNRALLLQLFTEPLILFEGLLLLILSHGLVLW